MSTTTLTECWTPSMRSHWMLLRPLTLTATVLATMPILMMTAMHGQTQLIGPRSTQLSGLTRMATESATVLTPTTTTTVHPMSRTPTTGTTTTMVGTMHGRPLAEPAQLLPLRTLRTTMLTPLETLAALIQQVHRTESTCVIQSILMTTTMDT